MPEGHFKWVFPSLPRNGLERRFQEFMKKWHNFIGDEVYIDEPMYGYVPDMEKCATRNCIYKGFWQSEKYLDIVRMIYVNSLLFCLLMN